MKHKWSKRKYVLMLIPLLILALGFFLLNAGNLLAGHHIPQQSEAIIVLSGDNGRLEEGIRLFHSGYGNFLVLSNSDYLDLEKVLKAGIPRSSVIFENKAINTYTNALYTKKLMEKNNLKSAVVVTSEYHMIRSKYIFDKVYKGSHIKLSYKGSKVQVFDPGRWWENEASRYVVFIEYLKFIRYIFLY